MRDDVADKCLEIIQATHDGDDLLPWQLKMVENACNDFLNSTGWGIFDLLVERVKDGTWREFTDVIAMKDWRNKCYAEGRTP
jgi:hypothetical protein